MIRTFLALSALALVAPQAKEGGPKKFAASDEEFPNPERGLMVFINLAEKGDLSYLRGKGYSLVFANVSLAAFRGGPLAADFLAKLDQGFQRVRAAGLKIVLRFTYSGNIGDADAPKAIVLQHIAQLKPLLMSHGDVIAVLQAGFIGAWGEWHGSTHGNDNDGVRREVVTALLDAAMGGACWSVLDRDQAFLTADLRVEFLRSAHIGTLIGRGWVVRRTRRVVFCAAELRDSEGVVLATSRCTQVVLPASGRAGRYEKYADDGSPPDDARG